MICTIDLNMPIARFTDNSTDFLRGSGMISIITMVAGIILLYLRYEGDVIPKEGNLYCTLDWLCCIFTALTDHVTFYILYFPR